MSQAGDMIGTSRLPPASEAKTMMIMDTAMMSMPRKILTGVEGSLPAGVQAAEERRRSGVRARMKNGSKNW